MMGIIKISLKNHAMLYVECEQDVSQELCDHFTFYVPGYKFMPSYKNKMWDGKIRLFSLYNRELPGGLLKYVIKFSKERNYSIEYTDNPVYGIPNKKIHVDMDKLIGNMVITSNSKPIAHHDYQLEGIKYGIEHSRSLLVSPTGSGKSLIIYTIVRWFLSTTNTNDVLIIVPTTSLVEQLYKDFGDYSEFDNGFDVLSACHKIYSGSDKGVKKRITISTWQSIYKLKQAWFERFGMVIGDEAHNFKAKSLISILSKCINAEHRYGTTGTLDGTETHKLVLEGYFGPAHYVTTTKILMDRGDLATLDISILLLKYKEAIRSKITKGLTYQEEVDYIVQYPERNMFISRLALEQEGNTLILFQFVQKHGVPLYKLVEEMVGDDRKIFFVSGSTDVETREATRSIVEKENNAIIVASMGTFSTGINIKNLHNIIFASPSKSQIRVLQSIGRGLRKSDNGKDTKLFDIADDLSWKRHRNYTLLHSAERIKIYTKEKFKFKIHEINI
jgi:superfamily II DNA or RNA helicase